jgi:hypothetical protein
MNTRQAAVLAAIAGLGLSQWTFASVLSMQGEEDKNKQSSPAATTPNEKSTSQPAEDVARAGAKEEKTKDPLAEQLAAVRPSLRLTANSAGDEAMKKASLTRAQKEGQLRAIRRKHFGHVKSPTARQEGLAKLIELAEPAMFPLFIEVFSRDDLETKKTIMSIFARDASDAGDSALMWMAVYDKDAAARAEALAHINKRKESWPVTSTPRGVQLVAFEALGSRDSTIVARGGNIVDALNIVEALPWMIAGQVRGSSSGGTQERAGALAWIAVGTQTNYVSDLEPIVSEGAVAFDPEISTIMSGTLIRVMDAVVVTYNMELHGALTRMSKRLTQQDTEHLGWNYAAWKRWYAEDFKPMWAAKVQTELDKRAGGASEEISPLAMEQVEWPKERRVK